MVTCQNRPYAFSGNYYSYYHVWLSTPRWLKSMMSLARESHFFPIAWWWHSTLAHSFFFNDTKLVSIHADLKVLPRRVLPKPNITCDPVQAAFYANILDSVASLRRTTHRLHSLQGLTNLLECDSFLRRFYVYSTGILCRCFVLHDITPIVCRNANHGHVLPAACRHPMNSLGYGYVSHVVLLCAIWEFLAYFGHCTMSLPGKVAIRRRALI